MISKRKVLVVSSNKDTFTIIKDVLPTSKYSLSFVSTVMETKQTLHKEHYHIVIIQTPVKDEFGVKSALDIVKVFGVGVVLLVKNNIYDQVCYKVQENDIFVVSVPTNKQSIYQSIIMMDTLLIQKEKLEKEIVKLKKKIQDDRKINQAKLMLIEQYHWTEDKAHHYIEKIAMDSSQTRVEVAMSLLDRMSD